MTFVCVSATADPCRYVWFTGGGFAFARIEDHRRWAIAKIWRWCFRAPARVATVLEGT